VTCPAYAGFVGVRRRRENPDTIVVRLGVAMDALTIHEAAETTGWSPRMLRYIERIGLIEPQRSAAGYRLYGPAELQRLRTLRELLADHDLDLGDVGFALRLRRDGALRNDVDSWFEAKPERPSHVPASNWLAFEQDKHSRLLAAVAARAARTQTTTTENA
jgi:DNA-binding transcriptional MerR regulator